MYIFEQFFGLYNQFCRRNQDWEIILTSFWSTLMTWRSSLEMTLQIGDLRRMCKKGLEQFHLVIFFKALIEMEALVHLFLLFWVRKMGIHWRKWR